MDEAQRLENQRLITIKEDRARREAEHWTIGMLWRIVRGDPPAEFAQHSAKRVAMLERACLILIDVARERRPDDPDVWTEGPLTLRINKLKETYAEAYAREEEREEERRRQHGWNHGPLSSGRSPWGSYGDPRGPIGNAELPWREK